MTSSTDTGTEDVGALLADLIAARGDALMRDRRRLLGLLRDKAPGSRRVIGMLMTAFDHGVPGRLRGVGDATHAIAHESDLLASRAGMSQSFAHEAVSLWAHALGHRATVGPPSEPPQQEPPPLAPAAATPPPVEALPPVQALPMQPLQVAAAGPAETAVAPHSIKPEAVASHLPSKRRRIRVGVAIAIGAALVIVALPVGLYVTGVMPWPSLFTADTTSGSSPSSSAQPPPRAVPHPTSTPEGYPVVANGSPSPTLDTRRLRGDPNSLVFAFGILVDGRPASYEIGASFRRGQRDGKGYIKAFRDGQVATTGTIKVQRAEFQSYIMFEVSGEMTSNRIAAPNLCVTVYLKPMTITRMAVADGSFFSADGRYPSGVCGGPERYGIGYLR